MKKISIIIFSSVAIVVGLTAWGLNSNYFSTHVLGFASKASGRSIQSEGKVDINWGWPVTTLDAQNLTLDNFDQGSDPTMASVESAHVSINFYSLLKGDLYLPVIILKKPNILLEKDKDGNANWNFTDNLSGAAAAEAATPDDRSDFPIIGKLVIEEGQLIYKDPTKKTDVKLVIETAAGGSPTNKDLRFSGDGNYQGHDFKVNLEGGNIFQLKNTEEPYPIDVQLNAGGTKAVLKGTVLDPIKLKGVDIELNLAGPDASELFTLIGVALPPTPPYDIKGHLTYKNDKWDFENFKGRMGDSDLRGSVTWDTNRDRPLLSGEFISEKLDFDDLGGFVGATPSTSKSETSSKKQKVKATAKEESPYVIPDTPLDISRLSAMDAKVTFTGKKLISQALPLDDFYMNVDLDNKLLQVNPVRFGTAKGDITTILTVNAREEPVKIKGDFTFRRLQLKPIFEKIADKLGTKNVSDGYLGGTAKLEGTGKSMRQMLTTAYGDVGLGMEGGRLSNLIIELLGLDVAQSLGFLVKGDEPVPIRCMVGDFSVKNGLMEVRRFVLDTTDSNITGTGDINLKDETLDMKLYSQPKDTSIVSLNSPITMKGTLKNPKINVNFTNIVGRGAAAAAVGAVIFPVVGLVAFIEPGLGKDSNCVGLIKDMEKKVNKQGKAGLIPKNKK